MPIQSKFDRLLLDGFPFQGSATGLVFDDPITLMLRKLIRDLRLGLDLGIIADGREVSASNLVLLSWSENHTQEYLDRIVSTGAKMVAQVPDDCPVAPETVAKYLGNGLIYCFVRASSREGVAAVESCLRQVFMGAPPFDKFNWVTAKGAAKDRPKRIFLSRPSARKELLGIRSVLQGLNIECLDPLLCGGGGIVHQSVHTGIDNCDGVIGHFGQTFSNDHNGAELTSYNANVMYELGYAAKAGKPMVLFGDPRDKDRWPADLQGHVINISDDPIEIIQRVHYGLAI